MCPIYDSKCFESIKYYAVNSYILLGLLRGTRGFSYRHMIREMSVLSNRRFIVKFIVCLRFDSLFYFVVIYYKCLRLFCLIFFVLNVRIDGKC